MSLTLRDGSRCAFSRPCIVGFVGIENQLAADILRALKPRNTVILSGSQTVQTSFYVLVSRSSDLNLQYPIASIPASPSDVLRAQEAFRRNSARGKMTSSGVMFCLRWRNARTLGYAQSVAVAHNGLDSIARNNLCATPLRFARRILRSRDDLVITWTSSLRGGHHRGRVPLLPSFRCARNGRRLEQTLQWRKIN